jgi:polysaccharide deacetylase family protein (PEP-CTERM system associated)
MTGLSTQSPKGEGRLINAMSVDVEDYFQVSAFERHVDRDDWDSLPCRVPDNLARILELFDRHGVRATFFTLGWVAERYPRQIREVAERGHEVASHGYAHHRVPDLDQDAFRHDVAHTKALLEDITGQPVKGYRAPSYSIGEGDLWALDVLEAEGYRYSSSVYPIRHDLYGMPSAPRHPFRPAAAGQLLEIPVTTVALAGRTLPCGGGGFFRLYPYAFSRWALRRVNRREGRAGMFYFHPWEIDPGQPRVEGLPLRTRFRHYLNLGRMEKRLNRLLGDFLWDRVDRVFLATEAGEARP